MKKKILRLHVVPVKNDPIAELNIGKIIDETELLNELQNI